MESIGNVDGVGRLAFDFHAEVHHRVLHDAVVAALPAAVDAVALDLIQDMRPVLLREPLAGPVRVPRRAGLVEQGRGLVRRADADVGRLAAPHVARLHEHVAVDPLPRFAEGLARVAQGQNLLAQARGLGRVDRVVSFTFNPLEALAHGLAGAAELVLRLVEALV